MNAHDEISDDELLLYHYRDGLDPAERERIAAALLAQPAMAARLQALVAQLDAVAAIPDEPVPAHALQRWRATLDWAAANEVRRAPRPTFSKPLRWAALAAAVAVVIAFRLGMQLAEDRNLPSPVAAVSQPTSCECGLKWHLASAERQLVEVGQTSGAERAALIDAVITQNRMYTIAAERAGDQRLAGALRSFTPILERLAQTDGRSSESAAEMAQLNFEFRVVQARLAAEAGASAAPAESL